MPIDWPSTGLIANVTSYTYLDRSWLWNGVIWVATKNWAVSDFDANVYISAVEVADGQALENGVRLAIDNFVTGCKSDGTWAAIKSCCILAGARTLAGALVPLAGSAPINFNFVVGDYNRKTGLIGNGSYKYINSNRSLTASSQDNAHLALYVSTADTGGSGTFANYAGGSNQNGAQDSYFKICRFNDIYGLTFLSALSRCEASNSIGSIYNTGFMGHSRIASGSFIGRSANNDTTINEPSISQGDYDIAIFTQNYQNSFSGYTDARMAFYSIGDNLTLASLDTRVTALINAYAAAIP